MLTGPLRHPALTAQPGTCGVAVSGGEPDQKTPFQNQHRKAVAKEAASPSTAEPAPGARGRPSGAAGTPRGGGDTTSGRPLSAPGAGGERGGGAGRASAPPAAPSSDRCRRRLRGERRSAVRPPSCAPCGVCAGRGRRWRCCWRRRWPRGRPGLTRSAWTSSRRSGRRGAWPSAAATPTSAAATRGGTAPCSSASTASAPAWTRTPTPPAPDTCRTCSAR